MKKIPIALLVVAALTGCAVPTTGVIPRSEGMHTVTRQGNGFWVQPAQLTNEAILEASAYCEKSGKKYKQVHVKEIPAGALGRWPETELLFRCD